MPDSKEATKRSMDRLFEMFEESLHPPIIEAWPHTVDKTDLYTDGSIELKSVNCTDSFSLVLNLVDGSAKIRIRPSPLYNGVVDDNYFTITDWGDAVEALRALTAYYRYVIKPATENM